jgi:hypothetical protein
MMLAVVEHVICPEVRDIADSRQKVTLLHRSNWQLSTIPTIGQDPTRRHPAAAGRVPAPPSPSSGKLRAQAAGQRGCSQVPLESGRSGARPARIR